jgi:predicted transcriptional regulator
MFTPKINTVEDIDTLYQILANQRRRKILECLSREEGKTVTVRDIADYVSKCCNIERKTAYISVYQTHLGRLEQAGYISWNIDTGNVELTALGQDGYRLHQHLQGLLR